METFSRAKYSILTNSSRVEARFNGHDFSGKPRIKENLGEQQEEKTPIKETKSS